MLLKNKKKILELRKFEEDIVELFNNKKIRAPIHLSYGNERPLIEIFKKIRKNDWIFCSWRSHYHCLLKGMSPNELKKKIVKGDSISLCSSKYKIYSSAIVGGIAPIATGVAFSNKLKKNKDTVYCFVGDMTSETGIFYECVKYSENQDLKIKFIIEDNNLSVCSDTRKVWKEKKLFFEKYKSKKILIYKYNNKFPHAGSGTRINF